METNPEKRKHEPPRRNKNIGQKVLNLNDITLKIRLGHLKGRCFEKPYVSYYQPLLVILKKVKPQYIPVLFMLLVACSYVKQGSGHKLKHQIDSLSAELEKAKTELIHTNTIASKPEIICFENEDFDSFFWKFMTDSVFQINRIKFPLKYITWGKTPYGDIDVGGDIDTIQIIKAKWQYDPFYIKISNERTQVYDNFELKFRPTNERLLHWYGIESGGDAKYFFKGFGGKWYLIEKEQLGD
ncbi:hypothetical protein ACE1ET_01150 [Saccharicrinis sp. FJH62]|uniref:hypothetical protein n=1 Tax=Saccharicrinis sp. FJH62 TaxID=3344657 RepID=UPI0035D490BC